MSGPVGHFASSKAPVAADPLKTSGWDDLKKMMMPAVMPDPFRPDDEVMMELARYAETAEGRKVLGWLHSITDQAPYPQYFGSIEQTALASVKHQGRCMPGVALNEAVAIGKTLRSKLKG